jgi:hypothetical protein
MTPMFLRVCSVAGGLAVGMAAFAQTTGQQPAQPQPRTQTTTPAPQRPGSAGQIVTVAGCIQSEADYRKVRNLGRGGAAGSAVGIGNEFVLIDTKMASAGAPPAAGAATGATGTTGAAAQDYKLTGANEGKASQFVGKRVEITGTLKPTGTAGAARSGGPTTGGPPPQIDVFAGEDLKLGELEMTSVRETAGTCPAK